MRKRSILYRKPLKKLKDVEAFPLSMLGGGSILEDLMYIKMFFGKIDEVEFPISMLGGVLS